MQNSETEAIKIAKHIALRDRPAVSYPPDDEETGLAYVACVAEAKALFACGARMVDGRLIVPYEIP